MSDKVSAASVAIFFHAEVLLIQRAHPPAAGCWTLPGGRLETGETAMDCALREVREELGLSLLSVHPLTEISSSAFLLHVFVAHMVRAGISPSEEVSNWRWVNPDNVESFKTTPDLSRVLALAMKEITLM